MWLRNINQLKSLNKEKSDIYSLGMTLLHALTL